MYKKIVFIIILFLTNVLSNSVVFADETLQNTHEVMKARVEEVLLNRNTDTIINKKHFSSQTLKVVPLEGSLQGKSLEVVNDYNVLKKGDIFFLTKITYGDSGEQTLTVGDIYRINKIFWFIFIFVLFVMLFGGIQGIRGLLSLFGSLFIIVYILLPNILNGFSPVLLSIAVSSFIIIFGSYITHGFNRTTSSAVIGMIITVLFIGIFASFSVGLFGLTGLDNEEAVYLNFSTNGNINFGGLLLGGIVIGLLGVLYDAAIGQAVAVEELFRASSSMTRRKVFLRATRIGREHIGALVNTLAIAYVGTSLPLLLLFFDSEMPFLFIINKEMFATEILRTLIGSIGLVLAVPVTTLVATFMLSSFRGVDSDIKDVHHFHKH